MRALHAQHSLPSFPVYSSAFISPNELVLGGGGGASRSGIKNKLRLYHVGNDRTLEIIEELELAKDEDAPMSMAADTETKTFACGINSAEEKILKGDNQNCRVYRVEQRKLELLGTHGTLTAGGDVEDEYQKVTVLSPDSKLIAVAGSHSLSLLSFPSLLPVVHGVQSEKHEIYDATFSATALVVATTANLLVYALPVVSQSSSLNDKEKGKQRSLSLPPLELLRTVELPTAVGGASGSAFRAVRFHPHDDKILYTVTNTVPTRARNKKSIPRQGFVCKWSTESWTVTNVKNMGNGGLTCFDISGNGKLLGFGSSQCTIGLLDANALTPVVTILKAHEFPPTTLKFNPTSTLLVSGSADNSVRIVSVPNSAESSWGLFYIILLTLFVILFGMAAQTFLQSGSLKW